MKFTLKRAGVCQFFVHGFCLVLMLVAFTQCKGGLCAARDDALSDADSDCFADLSDNCPVVYNPDQFDGDEDSQGEACDSDDTDSAAALINGADFDILLSENVGFESEYITPESNTSIASALNDSECQYYLVGCEGYFIGSLSVSADESSMQDATSEFGNANSDYSILNPLGFYGRPSSNCSSFANDATLPPAIYCNNSTDDSNTFQGYLTSNPDISAALDTCATLNGFGIDAEWCE